VLPFLVSLVACSGRHPPGRAHGRLTWEPSLASGAFLAPGGHGGLYFGEGFGFGLGGHRFGHGGFCGGVGFGGVGVGVGVGFGGVGVGVGFGGVGGFGFGGVGFGFGFGLGGPGLGPGWLWKHLCPHALKQSPCLSVNQRQSDAGYTYE
jgi:hypothetical protein